MKPVRFFIHIKNCGHALDTALPRIAAVYTLFFCMMLDKRFLREQLVAGRKSKSAC